MAGGDVRLNEKHSSLASAVDLRQLKRQEIWKTSKSPAFPELTAPQSDEGDIVSLSTVSEDEHERRLVARWNNSRNLNVILWSNPCDFPCIIGDVHVRHFSPDKPLVHWSIDGKVFAKKLDEALRGHLGYGLCDYTPPAGSCEATHVFGPEANCPSLIRLLDVPQGKTFKDIADDCWHYLSRTDGRFKNVPFGTEYGEPQLWALDHYTWDPEKFTLDCLHPDTKLSESDPWGAYSPDDDRNFFLFVPEYYRNFHTKELDLEECYEYSGCKTPWDAGTTFRVEVHDPVRRNILDELAYHYLQIYSWYVHNTLLYSSNYSFLFLPSSHSLSRSRMFLLSATRS